MNLPFLKELLSLYKALPEARGILAAYFYNLFWFVELKEPLVFDILNTLMEGQQKDERHLCKMLLHLALHRRSLLNGFAELHPERLRAFLLRQ